MTPRDFHHIYRELIEENPLAVRAVLKVLHVEFTNAVPTLAVTCEGRPRLLVNLEFVRDHCRTEAHVKAVICHEFLHVLLRHTERFTTLTRAEHLALDAVINAIIHRTLGPDSSGMMREYYAGEAGIARLLRPPADKENAQIVQSILGGEVRERRVLQAWGGLYRGTLVADDIRDLARDHFGEATCTRALLLGGHDTLAGDAYLRDPEGAAVLAEALDASLRAMNGSGVFRGPRERGVGAVAYRNEVRAADAGVERWRQQTYQVLRRHLQPDSQSTARDAAKATVTLPVLSPGDRRAALRAGWSVFLPEARWETSDTERVGTAQVYLDVSGSMSAEMPLVIALLGRLLPYIRRPFWAFSNVVVPARIVQGRLVADTTGGTSLSAVLEHVARTKPRAAVVVTDGYIEPVHAAQVAATAGTRLHVVVTRDGNPTLLQRAGLSYTQLSRMPA